MKNKKFKILFFSGYRGKKNKGDDAMALNIMERMTQKNSNLEFVVLINRLINPLPLKNVSYLSTFSAPMGRIRGILNVFSIGKKIDEFLSLIRYVYIAFNAMVYQFIGIFLPLSKKTQETIKGIKTSDLVWIGGGGTINDAAIITGIYGVTCICSVAKIFQKKIVITGQGLGPITGSLNRWILSLVLPKVELMGLRDKINSKKVALSLNVPKEKIFPVGDDAISLRTLSNDTIKKIFQNEHIPLDKPLLGVCIRGEKQYAETQKRFLIKILNHINQKYSFHIVFISSSYQEITGDDREAGLSVLKNMEQKDNSTILIQEFNAIEIKSIVSRMDFLISFTYHPLVFALGSNVPAIGFYNNKYYQLKLKGLFEWFDMEKYVKEADINNFSEIMKIMDDVIITKNSVKPQLLKGTQSMSSRVDEILEKIHLYISNQGEVANG